MEHQFRNLGIGFECVIAGVHQRCRTTLKWHWGSLFAIYRMLFYVWCLVEDGRRTRKGSSELRRE